MQLIFSEYPADYENYYFPYHIWAKEEHISERDELLQKGFLPTRFKVSLWYLARSSRVNLKYFELSSENRRILKQTDGVTTNFLERNTFRLNADHLSLVRTYIDNTIPTGFSDAAVKRIFSALLSQTVEEYKEGNKIVGCSPIMKNEMSAFYWYGFYNLEYQKSGLGMRAMLDAVMWAKEQGLDYLYLGTVYTNGSLYKTNIPGFEFFDGFNWQQNKDELKYLINKDTKEKSDDLLLDTEFQKRFYNSPTLTTFLNQHV